MTDIKLLALLIKEIGQPVAGKIWQVINGSDYQNQMKKASEICHEGASALSALNRAFGNQFNEILNDAINPDGSCFSFEAGRKKYVHLTTDSEGPDTIIPVLRDELNVNLERITGLHKKDKDPVQNYFRGCFVQWSDNYKKQLAPLSIEEEKNFKKINKLIDGRHHAFVGILDIFRKTILGTSGMMIIGKACLIILSVGIGIYAQTKIWLLGLPLGLIASCMMAGAVLIVLASLRVKKLDIMSECVRIAYGMLEKRSVV